MKLLKIIYVASFLPLLSGSLIFFYWFYKRTCFAENIYIEAPAFFALIGFLLLGLLVVILCIGFVIKHKIYWKKIIIPLLIICITIPVIDLYGTMHNELSQKAFVHIISDTDQRINRIWSDNFEIRYAETEGKDFILSFNPVYTFNWQERVRSFPVYEINKIHVDVDQNGSLVTYDFPDIEKGDCETIRISQLKKNSK